MSLRPYQYKIGSIVPVHLELPTGDFTTVKLPATTDPSPGDQAGYEHGEDYPWLIQVHGNDELGINGLIWVGWNEDKSRWEFMDGFLSAIHIIDHE